MWYLEQLEQIVSDLQIGEAGDERAKINIIEIVEHLRRGRLTREMDLEAGSLTTSLSSMIAWWPLSALSILISLLILLFLTGLRALMTMVLSSWVEMPV